METLKRREWFTWVLMALGLLSLGAGALKVQAAEKPVTIHVSLETTIPDQVPISIRAQDSVKWQCHKRFTIKKFTKDRNEVQPFYRQTPFESTQTAEGLWVVSSGPAKLETEGEYKTTIVVDGLTEPIDPHISIIP
ncbi:hypothetical protein MYX77_06450 [Acidobacteriia bacterium AH_259_A11_L15]|nr:hypothetical protein [Acidobacteriia bacterium AH_259_A11_L15]